EEIELAVHVFDDRIQAASALQLDSCFKVPGDPDLPVDQLRRGNYLERSDLLQLRGMIINAARGIALPYVQFPDCQFLYIEEPRLCTSGVHVHVYPLLRPASPKSRKRPQFLGPHGAKNDLRFGHSRREDAIPRCQNAWAWNISERATVSSFKKARCADA